MINYRLLHIPTGYFIALLRKPNGECGYFLLDDNTRANYIEFNIYKGCIGMCPQSKRFFLDFILKDNKALKDYSASEFEFIKV